MRTLSIHSSVSLAVLALASPAFADSGAAPLDQVVVTASRTPQPLEAIGQSVTVLNAETLRLLQTKVVSDLLLTVPGVSMARNGGLGTSTAVFIRGAESDQTVVLIDGVKLNDPSSPGGGFNFANLLARNIGRIEVLRGPSSVIWGSQAIGGVVNLISAPPGDAIRLNARAEFGSLRTSQAAANVSGRTGPLSASLGAGYFHTGSVSAFSAERGGKEADGYLNRGANLNLNYALSPKVSVDARGYYSDGKVGIDGYPPPSYNFGDTREFAKTRDMVGYLGLNAALMQGRFHNRLGLASTDTRRRNYDPDGHPVKTFAGDGRNGRFEYQGVWDLSDTVQAAFGAERETSRFTTASYGGPKTRGHAQIDSLYGQMLVRPRSGLTVTGGVRHDAHDRFGTHDSLAASAAWTLNEGATTLRASSSEGFKAPTLFQLQSAYGNAALRPEQAQGWDAGITQRGLNGKVEASATYFSRTSRDLISFISCPLPRTGICAARPYGTYDNVARAASEGVELGLSVQPVKGLSIQSNYTLLDAQNRSSGSPSYGKALIRRPRETANLSADYHWSSGLSAGASVTHVGSSYDDDANRRKLRAHDLISLRAAWPLSPALELYGRVENLSGARYETAYQYGAPGRAGYLGLRLSY
jgi:vitamin B12 transporter